MDFSTPRSGVAEPDQKGWQFAVGSAVLGWVLDAFNFFIIVFLLDTLAGRFHVTKSAVVVSLMVTLAMRPVGAFIFGAMADRYGRKWPLIWCVVYFTATTVLSGLAPNYVFFLAMRALYGIGMGGYWGIGASYAMESSPLRHRGILSGVMQAGYPMGYLLSAVVMQMVTPHWGWISVFYIGVPMGLLTVVLTVFAPESKAWKENRPASLGSIFSTMAQHAGIFFYLLLLMAAMLSLSHGTQDLYPDFLKSIPGMAAKTVLGMKSLYGIPILYNIGAITGAVFFGHISEKIGRRKAILYALAVSALSIPAWAFGHSLLTLLIGSYVMQTGVQGAFGVIPAHLNELSPDAVRSLFPGFAYQAGVLLSSPAVVVETVLKDHVGYPWALTLFEACVIGVLVLFFWFGPEAHGRSFIGTPANETLLEVD